MRAKKDNNKISELQRIVRKYDISMKNIAKNTGIKYCTVYYYVKTPFKYKPESDIYDTVFKIIMDVANKHNEVVNLEYDINSKEEETNSKEEETKSVKEEESKSKEEESKSKEKETNSKEKESKSKEKETNSKEKESKSKEKENNSKEKENNSKEKENNSIKEEENNSIKEEENNSIKEEENNSIKEEKIKEENKNISSRKFNTVINNVNKIKLQGHNFTKRPLIKRGDIFYINSGETHDSEQFAGRPAIIVGNEEENKYSPVVKVVYCTTKTKAKLPTHVMINSTKYNSTVLCEQITSVSINRVGHYIGSCTKTEMSKIDKALAISLQIPQIEDIKKSENIENIKEEIVNIEPTNKIIEDKEIKDNDVITTEKLKTLLELERVKVEAEIYKKFYDDYIQLQMKKV